MAVRRALLVPLMLLALILVPLAASAQQVPLFADLQHGIVVWDTSITLYKRGAGPHQRCFTITVGQDDVRRILGWGVDNVYLVLYVQSIDPWASSVPAVQATVAYPQQSIGNALYTSMWVNIPHPGVYEIPIPTEALRRASQLGGVAISLCLPDWNTNTANGAPDNFFKVTLDKVVIAPPQGAIADKPATHAQPAVVKREAWRLGPDDRAVLLGFGIVAVAIVVAAFVFARK